jgi:SAM-dependent methyltransferase
VDPPPSDLLAQPERRVSFDAVVEIYDRVRHDYPAPAFEELFNYVREGVPGAVPDVAEIGPGTGKATLALLERGAQVTGVELGSQMAAYLLAKLGGDARLRVVEGAFEAVDLPKSSFDLVFAATSFHWVDPAVRVERSLELLRPLGAIGTLSTVQVAEAVGGFFERSQPIYAKYDKGDRQTFVAPAAADAVSPEYAGFLDNPGLGDVELRRYPWDQTYSRAEYADLMRSYSNIRMMPEGERESLIFELGELIDAEFDGGIVRPLVIVLTMARKVG